MREHRWGRNADSPIHTSLKKAVSIRKVRLGRLTSKDPQHCDPEPMRSHIDGQKKRAQIIRPELGRNSREPVKKRKHISRVGSLFAPRDGIEVVKKGGYIVDNHTKYVMFDVIVRVDRYNRPYGRSDVPTSLMLLDENFAMISYRFTFMGCDGSMLHCDDDTFKRLGCTSNIKKVLL